MCTCNIIHIQDIYFRNGKNKIRFLIFSRLSAFISSEIKYFSNTSEIGYKQVIDKLQAKNIG